MIRRLLFSNRIILPFILLSIAIFIVGCGETTPSDPPISGVGGSDSGLDIPSDAIVVTPIVVGGESVSQSNTGGGEAYPVPVDSNGYPIPSEVVVATLTPIPAVEAPPVEQGFGSFTGFVYSRETGLPMRNVPMMLAEIYGEGDSATFVLDVVSSPFTEVDVNGQFLFTDVPPAQYSLVVGDIENNNYEVVIDFGDTAKIWTVEADQQVNIGTIEAKELVGYETK